MPCWILCAHLCFCGGPQPREGVTACCGCETCSDPRPRAVTAAWHAVRCMRHDGTGDLAVRSPSPAALAGTSEPTLSPRQGPLPGRCRALPAVLFVSGPTGAAPLLAGVLLLAGQRWAECSLVLGPLVCGLPCPLSFFLSLPRTALKDSPLRLWLTANYRLPAADGPLFTGQISDRCAGG